MIDFDKLWKPSSVRTYYAVLLSSVEHEVDIRGRQSVELAEDVSNKQVSTSQTNK